VKLHGYFRSSATYRVRLALELKGLAWDASEIHLLDAGGQQNSPEYRALHPQGLVPTLVDGDRVLHQSLAIIEYLEECHPDPPLLPAAPEQRARVRALAQIVACDIHPLNNLRVLQYLSGPLGASEPEKQSWYRHWVAEGFAALETLLARDPATGTHCHGDRVGLADVCLVPQVFNARRYACPLDAYPTILRIDEACAELPAFQRAHPDVWQAVAG
jgi:maleylacetoacetate isomerase